MFGKEDRNNTKMADKEKTLIIHRKKHEFSPLTLQSYRGLLEQPVTNQNMEQRETRRSRDEITEPQTTKQRAAS